MGLGVRWIFRNVSGCGDNGVSGCGLFRSYMSVHWLGTNVAGDGSFGAAFVKWLLY